MIRSGLLQQLLPRDVMELGQYDLYHAGVRRPESAMSGFPATITPPDDGDFSNNLWPNGWKDIDPFESYRAIFNGSLAASDNPELIFTVDKTSKKKAYRRWCYISCHLLVTGSIHTVLRRNNVMLTI